MSHPSISLQELVRAFAHMLPSAGDVLMSTSSSEDVRLLVRENIHLLCPTTGTARVDRASGSSAFVVNRNIDIRYAAFSPQLFSGVWLRVDGEIDSDLVRAAFRLLVPRGLAVVITSSVANLQGLMPRSPISHDNFTIEVIATINLEDRTNSAGALLLNSSQFDSSLSQRGCPFCMPSRFEVNRHFNLPGGAAALWGDDVFTLIPDVAPIDRGHLLLTSTKHVPCMGALSAEQLHSLEEHLTKVEQIFQRVYNRSPIFVEHGATRSHRAGSCVDHAHMHCLPNGQAVSDALKRAGLDGVSGSAMMAKEFFSRSQPYLLIRMRGRYWYFPANDLPCQFLRLMMSNSLSSQGPRWQHVLQASDNAERYTETVRSLLPAADAMWRDILEPSKVRQSWTTNAS